jgi:hypothetical protein
MQYNNLHDIIGDASLHCPNSVRGNEAVHNGANPIQLSSRKAVHTRQVVANSDLGDIMATRKRG